MMPTFFHSLRHGLGPTFFKDAEANTAPKPSTLWVHETLASLCGFDPQELNTPQGAAWLTGNAPPPGSQPLAMAYAGHQFGHFSPTLGDGRAMLLGEIQIADAAANPCRLHTLPQAATYCDLHLKGSGPTAFSRGGDGQAPLDAMLREVLISEAMAHLGVPTSRSVAVATTGTTLHRRNRHQPVLGAVLMRLAPSHLRVGTFEWAASHTPNHPHPTKPNPIQTLCDYACARHLNNNTTHDTHPTAYPAANLLQHVVHTQAHLVAQWQGLGFVHGVLNTDNVAIAGFTFDYGPCAFVDTYNSQAVFSSIDQHGRYALGSQPDITYENLARLAQTLTLYPSDDPKRAIQALQEALDTFWPTYQKAYNTLFAAKLGLQPSAQSSALVDDLLQHMQKTQADYCNTFYALTRTAAVHLQGSPPHPNDFLPTFPTAWQEAWWQAYQAHNPKAGLDAMRSHNPRHIPRNHQVEHALQSALQNDLQPFERLLKALQAPYAPSHEDILSDAQPHTWLQTPPRPEQRVQATFCGT